jgi:hypothetical protein
MWKKTFVAYFGTVVGCASGITQKPKENSGFDMRECRSHGSQCCKEWDLLQRDIRLPALQSNLLVSSRGLCTKLHGFTSQENVNFSCHASLRGKSPRGHTISLGETRTFH